MDKFPIISSWCWVATRLEVRENLEGIEVAKYVSCSKSNGPGDRCVLWFQGCDKKCQECCNQELQEFKNINRNIDKLVFQVNQDIEKYNLRGITLTGGEPLHLKNLEKIKIFLNKIKYDIDVFVFSGLTKHEINQIDVSFVDLIIAGPYISTLKREKGLVSSSNQKIIRLSEKFNDVSDEQILNGDRIIEIYNSNGGLIISGLVNRKEILNGIYSNK